MDINGALGDAVARLPVSRFCRALRVAAIGVFVWCGVAVLTQSGSATLETIFFRRDLLWLLLIAIVLVGLSVMPKAVRIDARLLVVLSASRSSEAVLAIAIALVSFVGAHLVFHGYVLSGDEAMALFDATILRRGALLARVPEMWREYADALAPHFLLPIAGHAAWVSSYLPVNAAIHAVLDARPGLDLASGTLAALSIVALGGAARRLWPDRPDAALVAMLLLATSTQFLVTAFTYYAMTAHLALNLVWLCLLLRGGRLGHSGAIAVAALACGLHQVVFHPLFAAPFVVQLWAGRRWRLATLYTLAYAVIGLFWVLYWQLMLAHYGLMGVGVSQHGLAPFVDHVMDLLRAFSWSGLDLMAKNLTRFLAWQNPLMVPLVGLAVLAMRRLDGPIAALAAGILLTTAAMFVLLPYQGHGWGYRYLHGLLGSFSLLAAAGWIAMSRRATDDEAPRLWACLALSGLFALAIMLPGRAIEVETFIAPVIAAQRAIDGSHSELVLVDTNGTPFSTDLVRNDPFLRNHPLVMKLDLLQPAQVASLCASHTVALFDRQSGDAFGMLASPLEPETPGRVEMRAIGCGTRIAIAPIGPKASP